MKEIVAILIEDLKEPFSCIPLAFRNATLILCLLYLKFGRKTWNLFKCAYVLLLILYLDVVCVQTFFSREPGSRQGIDLQLFQTWGVTWQSHAYVIENVIMFFPLGILIPLIIQKSKSWEKICLISAALSGFIEIMQFVTGRGYFQLNDIMMNTLGGWIGYVCFKTIVLVKLLWYRLRENKRYSWFNFYQRKSKKIR